MKIKLIFIILFLAAKFSNATTLEEGNIAFQRKDYQSALKIFSEEAKNNDSTALLMLATIYMEGLGV